MRRLAAALLVLCASAGARAGEGVYLTFEGGYGKWEKDGLRGRLDAQNVGVDPVSGLGNTALLVDRQMPDGGIAGLRLGYNIAGHVGIEGALMLRPYDLLQDTRGGAVAGGLAVRWFPLQGFVRPNRQFDVSLLAGVDYVLSDGNGIHGPTASNPATGKLANTGRGFDGPAVELGLTAELYPAPWVSFGITPRLYAIDPLRYFVDIERRSEGGAIPIGGQGGLKLWSVTFSMTFHFSPQSD